MEQSPVVFSALAVVGFVLLIVVSGGIVYLTLADWRDRRRRESDTKNSR